MSKDDFKKGAETSDTTGKESASVTGTVKQFRPPVPGLRPPAPKPPFGMPIIPVATKVKLLPTEVKKTDAASQNGEDE